MSQKYKIGDRVMAVDNIQDHSKPSLGTIIRLWCAKPIPGRYDYLVHYDDGPVRWSNIVSPIQPPVIVITTDGDTTTATLRRGKAILKTATARCSPKDTYDFKEGARIAFERLQGRDPFPQSTPTPEPPKGPPLYSGKVICVDVYPGKDWTVGRIYTVNEGELRDDRGVPRLRGNPRTVEELNTIWSRGPYAEARFIPLVEG